MVKIVIGAIPPVLNNQSKKENPPRSPQKKTLPKEKRKSTADRRKDARSGVVVTLSKYPDRRKGGDRRKRNTDVHAQPSKNK
jgi:hypothetical protein